MLIESPNLKTVPQEKTGVRASYSECIIYLVVTLLPAGLKVAGQEQLGRLRGREVGQLAQDGEEDSVSCC